MQHKERHKTSLAMIAMLASFVGLASCGGSDNSDGGGGSGDTVNGGGGSGDTVNGVFLDAAVEGLYYVSGELSGTTDSDGAFQCEDGESVQFSIRDSEDNDFVIGSANCGEVITPIEVIEKETGESDLDESDARVLNIVQLMLTLDENNDATDGITISDDTKEGVGSLDEPDFTSTDFDSSAPVLALLNALSAGALVDATEAQDHLEDTLRSQVAGTWSGTYAGGDSGTWTVTISEEGVLTGSGNSTSGEPFGIGGTVAAAGNAEWEPTSGAAGDAVFSGRFNLDGSASGTWTSSSVGSGTWTGSKQ